MKYFFLKIWTKNVGAHYTWECIIHGKLHYLMYPVPNGFVNVAFLPFATPSIQCKQTTEVQIKQQE